MGDFLTGARVAELRRRAGLTQDQLAHRLDRSESWVSKIERGARPLTDLRVLGEVASALGVAVRDLVPDADSALDGASPGLVSIDEMRRRAFLLGLGVVAAGAAMDGPLRRLTAALDQPQALDDNTLRHLGHATVELERQYPQLAPRALIGLAHGHLSSLTMLLAGASDRLRRDVASLAGETAGLCGWLAFDLGDYDQALAYFDGALTAASEAGDAALGAYLLGSATTLPTFREQSPRSVVEVLRDGARGVRTSAATPSTAAWLATLEASAHARLGDRDAALHVLARAADVFADDDPETARPRVPFFDPARLAGERGIVNIRLGRTRQAATGEHLRTALATLDPSAKIRARFLTGLACVHADGGDVAGACRYATAALAVGQRSGTAASVEQVRELRLTRLARWPTHPAVRELDERLAASAA
jgi:transcriptional regulator with XRE-family HTH domain